jgi:hypothetical protein
VTENDIRIMLLRQAALFGGKEALADALGMSKQNLHRFLNGTQGLRHHKVLDALGVTWSRCSGRRRNSKMVPNSDRARVKSWAVFRNLKLLP